MSLFFYLFTFAFNMWPEDASQQTSSAAVFVNAQHGIHQRGPDFHKKFVFEEVHSKGCPRSPVARPLGRHVQ